MIFSISRFFKSFRFALAGIKHAFLSEQNFRIHLIVAVFVFALAWYFHIELWRWIVLLFVTFGVILTELVNTVFEKIIDILKPRLHPYARVVKDMMAAAVVLMSLLAVVIGVLVFWDYIRPLF